MEKKFYSFISCGDNCTMDVSVCHLAEKSIVKDDVSHTVITLAAPISNGGKTLSNFLKKDVTSDANGTTWIDVVFWDETANRFKKFLNGREKVRILVTGNVSLKEWTTKDGKPGQRVQLVAHKWKQEYAAPVTPVNTTEITETVETSDEEEMPF